MEFQQQFDRAGFRFRKWTIVRHDNPGPMHDPQQPVARGCVAGRPADCLQQAVGVAASIRCQLSGLLGFRWRFRRRQSGAARGQVRLPAGQHRRHRFVGRAVGRRFPAQTTRWLAAAGRYDCRGEQQRAEQTSHVAGGDHRRSPFSSVHIIMLRQHTAHLKRRCAAMHLAQAACYASLLDASCAASVSAGASSMTGIPPDVSFSGGKPCVAASPGM